MSAKAVAAFCNQEFTPAKVHVVPGLLDEIAHLVLDGYAATPHGGLEIGGLFFGHRSNASVSVEDFRPLPCDHSFGPRFILSEPDERGLRDLLRAPATDPALHRLDVIGWYCSQTRSDLLLLDRELVLHETYFSGPVDFVIIFKPRDLRSVTAGIFLRDADRIMNPQCPATILELPELDTPRVPQRTATSRRRDLPASSSQAALPTVNERVSISSRLSSTIEPAAPDHFSGEPGVVITYATPKYNQHSRSTGKAKLLLAAVSEQQLAATPRPSNHPGRRHARRTRHKKLTAASARPAPRQLQANQSP